MLVLTDVDEERIRAQLAADAFFWLDLESPSDADLRRLGELLEQHPVAMEDTHEFGQRPKIDVYANSVLVVYYSAHLTDGDVCPLEVHIYITGSNVVTVRREACDALVRLRDELGSHDGHGDEQYPVYRILDVLTDAYYPVIEGLESQIDALEGEVLESARREQLERIYRLRQEVREVHRRVAVQRDQFSAGREAIERIEGLRTGSREYLRDIADHLAQVGGELWRQGEDLSALTSTYFNANADRLNAVATRISILGTLFVVWTLVTGFFGQNFKWLTDHIETTHAFFIYGLGALLIPTAILLTLFWVKRHDWF
jgi:magnesium transporter